MRRALFLLLVFFSTLTMIPATACAKSNNASSDSQDHFAYSFSNFVWWSDEDLRSSLKRRIPTLEDTLPRNSPLETKIRAELIRMLREKGVTAEVQIFEPSLDVLAQKRVPEAPPPAIVFSVAAPPEILIEKLILENPPSDASGVFNETANRFQLKPYAATSFWFEKQQIASSLKQIGYLAASVDLKPGIPTRDGQHYLVPLTAIINAGAKYHVSTVKADGGPLFKGRDLSPYFALKPGDVATPSAFGRLAGLLRSAYWHAGYPDVEFQGEPELDTTTAMASYQFVVIPGPMYRLRSIKIENLNATQESQVKDLLGVKSGDIYDALAVTTLNQKMMGSSTLSGWSFSYTPHEDKQAHVVDLILTFYKN
jgi:outer membrane translocation and assembly module TamA